MIKTQQQSILTNDVRMSSSSSTQGDTTQMVIDEEEINYLKRKFEVEKASATPREGKSINDRRGATLQLHQHLHNHVFLLM